MMDNQFNYSWPKISKTESMVEDYAYNIVENNVLEFFEVHELSEITQEQIQQVQAFRDEYNEYSVLYSSFTQVLSSWEVECEAS